MTNNIGMNFNKWLANDFSLEPGIYKKGVLNIYLYHASTKAKWLDAHYHIQFGTSV